MKFIKKIFKTIQYYFWLSYVDTIQHDIAAIQKKSRLKSYLVITDKKKTFCIDLQRKDFSIKNGIWNPINFYNAVIQNGKLSEPKHFYWINNGRVIPLKNQQEAEKLLCLMLNMKLKGVDLK